MNRCLYGDLIKYGASLRGTMCAFDVTLSINVTFGMLVAPVVRYPITFNNFFEIYLFSFTQSNVYCQIIVFLLDIKMARLFTGELSLRDNSKRRVS